MPDEYTGTSGAVKCNHEWKLLYSTDHIRTYRCERCGKDVYEEGPFDAR